MFLAAACCACCLGQTPGLAAPRKLSGDAPPAPSRSEADLPAPLSAGDAELYRRALAVQASGDWRAADQLLARLKDQRLLFHVQAQRYLDPRYRPSYAELQAWLAAYADAPAAARIQQLATKQKRPAGAPALKAALASPALGGNGDDDADWRDQTYRARSEDKVTAALEAKVRDSLRKGNIVLAQHLLANAGAKTDALLTDALRADIAAALLAEGRDEEALALAQQAMRSVKKLPQASWVAGLASWRLGRKAEAAKFFAATADSPAAVPATVAAASFWAGRAYVGTGKPAEWTRWMRRAAQNPYTFYGLLATQELDEAPAFNWSLPALGAAELQKLQPYPNVARALALLQIGERTGAEAELRVAALRLPPALQPLLLTVAERGGMPGLAMRVAGNLRKSGGGRWDAALYPVPPWSPRAGYTLNRALIFAIMRQESHFNPDAQSRAGATGLMQLMPRTAASVERQKASPGPQGRERLRDPEVNLGLAQRLIDQLLGADQVRGNLFRLAAAYNGGIGKLTRWQDRSGVRGRDPLLFIESIPSPETRLFIERILTNYWIYQTRFAQPTDSLHALAEGDWPIYTPDPGQVEVADRNARN